MLQATSLISMLGMQAQQASVQPASSAVDPSAVPQTAADSSDQQGSFFQVVLKFMQSPNTASPAAHQTAAGESPIALPFPLEKSDDPASQDQSASAVMPFTPFMYTSIAQVQQALAALMRDQSASAAAPGTDASAPAENAVTAIGSNNAAIGSSSAVNNAASQPLAVKNAAQALPAAQPASLPSVAAPGSIMDVKTDAPVAGANAQPNIAVSSTATTPVAMPVDPVPAVNAQPSTTATTVVTMPAVPVPETPSAQQTVNAAADRSQEPSPASAVMAAESAQAPSESAAADARAMETMVKANSQMESSAKPAPVRATVAAEEKITPASTKQPEHVSDFRTAIVEANEQAASPAVQTDARAAAPKQMNASDLVMSDAKQADAAVSAADTIDPARTPDVFTRLQEMVAQIAEPSMPKSGAKTAAAQDGRTNVKVAAAESRPASVQPAKQNADAAAAPGADEPLAVQQQASVRASADQTADQASALAQGKTAHDAAQAAQRSDPASADLRAVKPDAAPIQHSGLATADMPARAVDAAHDAAAVLSPRAKEEVFEKVFREVSMIKHTPASVDVTLSPESLGKVTVNVGMDEGKMSARINVQNTDVKQILEANMPRLQDALNSSGLSLDSIAVFVNNGSSFAERRNDAPKKKMSGAGPAGDSGVDTLGSLQDAKQYGYNTVEYIM